MDAIAAGNPQLQRLNVMLCPEITGASMIELSHHCNDLRSLDINFDALITEESILAIAANCPNFNELVYGGDADEFSVTWKFAPCYQDNILKCEINQNFIYRSVRECEMDFEMKIAVHNFLA